VNLVARTGPGARDGAAHLDQVTEIRKSLQTMGHGGVPIIANGNVITWDDVLSNMEQVGV
jgi:tRNA-dihydrouridine synthase